jgi:hypothetical protein
MAPGQLGRLRDTCVGGPFAQRGGVRRGAARSGRRSLQQQSHRTIRRHPKPSDLKPLQQQWVVYCCWEAPATTPEVTTLLQERQQVELRCRMGLVNPVTGSRVRPGGRVIGGAAGVGGGLRWAVVRGRSRRGSSAAGWPSDREAAGVGGGLRWAVVRGWSRRGSSAAGWPSDREAAGVAGDLGRRPVLSVAVHPETRRRS